ncbi:coiled-coil domain-containing 47-like, partial [Paramuricea clavata]
MIAGLAAYALNFFAGRSKNSKLATAWMKYNRTIMQDNFSIVGDDGSGDEPQQGILVKESESHYSLWCSGRVNCEGLLVELKLLKRHDLVHVLTYMFKPTSDKMVATVYMSDEDMDNFVFAIYPKRTAGRMQKELQDLSFFCPERRPGEKVGLPSTYSVISESAEILSLLSVTVTKLITDKSDLFESLHFSDQYAGYKKNPDEAENPEEIKPPKARKVLIFTFNLPGKGKTKYAYMEMCKPLINVIFHFMDKVKKFKLSKDAKTKSDKKRREMEESFWKQAHASRQEAAQQRREDKQRAEKERMMNEDDTEKQRRWELSIVFYLNKLKFDNEFLHALSSVSSKLCVFPLLEKNYQSESSQETAPEFKPTQSIKMEVSQYTPDPFPLGSNRRIIAPFWADVDTRNGGVVYYRETQDLAIRTRVSEEIRKYFVRQRRFSAKWVLIVSWLNVARYGGTSSPS